MDDVNEDSLTNEELLQLEQLLAKLRPGFLPFTIFHQVVRLTVSPNIEVIPLRRNANGEVEVLLLERGPDDPIWPGQLHTPGTNTRATDAPGSYQDAFDRITRDELQAITLKKPVFITNIFHHSGRGMESSQIYWAEVNQEPIVGKFYTAHQLPENLVASQLDFIPLAIAAYEKATDTI